MNLKFSFLFYFFLFQTVTYSFSFELDPGGNAIKKGVDFYKENKPKKSLERYSNARKYLENNPKIDFNEGTSYYQDNKYNQAINSFRRSLEGQTKNEKAKTWYNIGNSYYKAGKKKESALSYIKSLQYNPNFENSIKNLEFLHKKQKNKQKKQNSKQEQKNSKEGQQPQPENQKEETQKEHKSNPKNNNDIEDMMKQFDLNDMKKKANRIENKKFFW